jgi:hypothetical protein
LGAGEEQAGLESIRTSHTAVAVDDACGEKVSYEPKNAVDGEPTTAWKVGGTGVGEWIELEYDKPIEVSRVGIIPGYAKTDLCSSENRFYQYRVVKKAKIEISDGTNVEKSFQAKPQMQFADVPDTETSSVPTRRQCAIRGTIQLYLRNVRHLRDRSGGAVGSAMKL